MQNIHSRLLTGSLVIILIGVVLGSIFFITSLAPDSSKSEISAFPSPNPDKLSNPEVEKTPDSNVAGVKTSPPPTKKPVPSPTKAQPTSVPTPTVAPTSAPTSTPNPTSEPTPSPAPTEASPSGQQNK